MATFNLVRNSRVFYTTNVNASTGVVNASGFTKDNTQELQVLDGFTFGQASNADTITISEAGNTPVRGQRSFNTSLAQADFSFSTYLRPSKATAVQCEESVLWNSLLGSVAFGASNAIAATFTGSQGATPTSVVYTPSSGSTLGYLTFVTTAATITNLIAGETVMVTGHVLASRNTALKILTIQETTPGDPTTRTGFTAQWVSSHSTVQADLAETSSNWDDCIFTRTAWNAQYTNVNTAGSVVATHTYAEVTSAMSNKNQLVKFGMIMVVDGITYVIDNCCMNQAVIDFGLDGIAMAAWTGMGTTLRQLSTQAVFTLPSNVATSLSVGTTITGGLASSAPAYVYKNTTADFITNKLSSVSLKAGINGSGSATNLALTGGSITINNNVTYVTPANLGVVNLPVGYYTGTRAISGSITAYLRTGATNTAGLLSSLLAASATSAGIEPKYQLLLAIGGSAAPTRVEVELPMAFLQIPTIDAAAVMSTTINFTAEGSASDGTSIDIENTNELEIRYIKA